MKNKKVKWSVISVTSLAFLSFAGLVTGNYNGENTTTSNNTGDSNNNTDSFAQNHHRFEGDSDTGWNDGSNAQSEWGQSDSDSDTDSSDDQDRFFQAPSGGFDQGEGHGSSGSSK